MEALSGSSSTTTTEVPAIGDPACPDESMQDDSAPSDSSSDLKSSLENNSFEQRKPVESEAQRDSKEQESQDEKHHNQNQNQNHHQHHHHHHHRQSANSNFNKQSDDEFKDESDKTQNRRKAFIKSSRWLSAKSGAASKRPIKMITATGGEEADEQVVSFNKNNKSGFQQTKPGTKMSSTVNGIKYIMVGKSEPVQEQHYDELQETLRDATLQQSRDSKQLEGEQEDNKPIDQPSQSHSQSQSQSSDDEQLSFEAIASAISTTLSAEQSTPEKSSSSASSIVNAEEKESLSEPASSGEVVERSARTTGQHVADVIDHIVERRKQARESVMPRSGPQIVVVAPVGGADLMKARSLTHETSDSKEISPSKEATLKKEADELKRKEASLGGVVSSSSSEKKTKNNKKRFQRPLGARLLGTLGDPNTANTNPLTTDGKPAIKYSERVEVIEDDDSSALLMKASPELTGEQMRPEHPEEDENEERKSEQNNELQRRESTGELRALEGDQMSSIHVSSHSGEPRSRSPRHGLPPSLAFERYAPRNIFVAPVAPMSAESAPIPIPASSRPESSLLNPESSPNNQPKLYSAEQLIRDHVMRSKMRNNKQPVEVAPLEAQERKEVVIVPTQHQHQQHQQVQQQQQQQPQIQHNSSNPIVQHEKRTKKQDSEGTMKQVKVMATTIKPQVQQTSTTMEPKRPEQENRQQQINSNPERGFESGIQSIRVPLFTTNYNQKVNQPKPQMQYQQVQKENYHTSENQHIPEEHHLQPEASEQEVSQQQQQQQQHQQQIHQNEHHNQQASSLPLFADQEYNVPAHMAATVIQDIQRSPSTINMVNGQATLISSAGQVPDPQHQRQHQLQQQMYQNSPASHSQQQIVAWNPQMAASAQRQQMMLAAARQMVSLNQQQQHFHHLNQQALHQNQNQNQQHHQLQQPSSQVLANRDSLEPIKQEVGGAPVVPARRGLGHPLAQFALRRLFQSLGQQAMQQEAQHQLQSRSMGSSNSQKVGPSDASLQGLSSAPSGSAILPNGEPIDSSNRQMRSLPNNAAVSQQMPIDQDVQESSYGGGHMQPAYHMAGGGGYGGGGGGQHYESENDKKSKGITFHFGGGPIGGGTQLITSPMGIFKHLMIPLMPNPRVNLNGKVVFGVVLEKTTAFGEPKKKYKFWGR